MRNSNSEPRNHRIKLRRIMNRSPFAINKLQKVKRKGVKRENESNPKRIN